MRDEPESDKIKSPREAARLMRFAGLVLDLDAFTLARESGEAIPLTHGEFALLCFFVSHSGRVLSRDALLEAMAGRRFEAFDRSVDVLVGRLRRKIEPDPKRPSLIVTVPGSGYRFAAQVRQQARLSANAGAADRNRRQLRRRGGSGSRAPERRHITALAAELAPASGRPAARRPGGPWRRRRRVPPLPPRRS